MSNIRNKQLIILGFDENTYPTRSEISREFRKLAITCHPDKNPSPEAAEEYKIISNAKDFLLLPLEEQQRLEEEAENIAPNMTRLDLRFSAITIGLSVGIVALAFGASWLSIIASTLTVGLATYAVLSKLYTIPEEDDEEDEQDEDMYIKDSTNTNDNVASNSTELVAKTTNWFRAYPHREIEPENTRNIPVVDPVLENNTNLVKPRLSNRK